MNLSQKLQLLRKQHNYSQEELAHRLGIARQTVSKWENGQAVPELAGLMLLSDLYGVTIDRIAREDDGCNVALESVVVPEREAVTAFLIRAKQNTYAGNGSTTSSCRPGSCDYRYEEGDFSYYDTYLGGEHFSGQEAVWLGDRPIWSMNYVGRVLDEHFTVDFLREALYHVPVEMPCRGPAVYGKGDYQYHCKVVGDFRWYQGYEEIFCAGMRVYECYFHGGDIR